MAQSPEQMTASMLANVEDKTGRKLNDWLKIIAASGLEKHGQITNHLKKEHGVTHGFASLLAHQALEQGKAPRGSADLVQAQYSGPKENLRPIYAKIIEQVSQFGNDVEVAPKKTYVSLRRSKQFALVQPSTKTRVDIGINLKGDDPGARLEASGSFNAMVSHRVRVSEPSQVDAELIGWLREAYQRA